MQEVALTAIQAPCGNISFAEARLIIECKLFQITTPAVEDFYTQSARDWLNQTYKQASHMRRYVFGEIMQVWVKR